MLAYTFYETDGRVMRYAEALAGEGVRVCAIVLRQPGQPDTEWINGVEVVRIQEREKNEAGKKAYLFRIVRFLFGSMAAVTRRHLRDPFDVVHVHSVPDFEVFAALVPKLTGARVILDIHDLVPEFYAAKFGVDADSPIVTALKLVERVSAAFADHVIAANDLWLQKIATRSAPAGKCSVFINHPDLSIFDCKLRNRSDDGRFVMIYPGTLNHHQGLDIAIRAFARACTECPNIEFHIHGEGSAKPGLARLVSELHLENRVFLRSPLPIREIATLMANADLGVVPKRNDSFGGEAFSTKILEFMALRTPIVVSRTRIDAHYFDESLLRFFEASDEEDLARAMSSAYRDRAEGARLAGNAYDFVTGISWANKRHEYLKLVGELSGRRSS